MSEAWMPKKAYREVFTAFFIAIILAAGRQELHSLYLYIDAKWR